MGNFGVYNASADESWVTDGSWCPKDTSKGELQLARVKWAKGDGLAPSWRTLREHASLQFVAWTTSSFDDPQAEARTSKLRREVRYKDEQADDDGTDTRQQHRTRRNILRIANPRMLLKRDRITRLLDGGIKPSAVQTRPSQVAARAIQDVNRIAMNNSTAARGLLPRKKLRVRVRKSWSVMTSYTIGNHFPYISLHF